MNPRTIVDAHPRGLARVLWRLLAVLARMRRVDVITFYAFGSTHPYHGQRFTFLGTTGIQLNLDRPLRVQLLAALRLMALPHSPVRQVLLG